MIAGLLVGLLLGFLLGVGGSWYAYILIANKL